MPTCSGGNTVTMNVRLANCAGTPLSVTRSVITLSPGGWFNGGVHTKRPPCELTTASAGASTVALMSGETDFAMPAVTSARPHVASGRMRALAITTKRPSSVFPDLPTIDSIYPGFDIDNWFALFAPAGTPQTVIVKVHAEAVKGMQHTEMKTGMTREGAEPIGNATAEFAAFFRVEIDKYAKIIKASGAKPES